MSGAIPVYFSDPGGAPLGAYVSLEGGNQGGARSSLAFSPTHQPS